MKYLGRSVCCVCCISLAIDGSRIAIRVSRRAHRPAAPLRAPCARFEQTSDDKRRSGVIGSERVQHFGVKKKAHMLGQCKYDAPGIHESVSHQRKAPQKPDWPTPPGGTPRAAFEYQR